MDAKDLRTETSLGDRSNDGSSKFTQGGSTLPCTTNKTFENMPSNPLGKVETPTSRPCAVIGPDRIVPHNSDAYLKKSHYEPWPHMDNTYRQPPEYPHKIPSYQSPIGNISPRLTFQENMQRIMVQPTYNSNKVTEDASYVLEKNLSKNTKLNAPTEPKYCEVPYPVNPISSDLKNTETCVPTMSNPRNYPQMWHPGGVNMRPSKPYSAPDMYQYPDYVHCAVPRPMPMARPHRTANEDSSHIYNETYHYHDSNIRFKPYPGVKERYPQARYEYVNSYTNPFHAPHPYPPYKYDVQKTLQPHPSHPQVPIKYVDNRLADPGFDGYHRPQQQGPFNVPYRNQVVHPTYGPMLGNNIPNKMYPYLPEGPAKPVGSNKLPYDNKLYMDYDTARNKGYPGADNYHMNDMRLHMKNQVIVPNYPASNMQPIHPHLYYRKENLTTKNFEHLPHLRHLDPSLNPNALTRLTSQFSPSAIAISPSDSTNSNDTAQNQGGSLEDCGYVSQSSTNSIRSVDSAVNRMPHDFFRRYNYGYLPSIRTSPMTSKPEMNSNAGKEKANIDVRQFLQMWNEGEEENGSNPREVKSHADYNIGSKQLSQYEAAKNREQLYVLGLVNVPSEELAKYEHIQKVSKLPDNIKGYNNIELLKHFEEAIESSNTSNTNQRLCNSRNYEQTKNALLQALPPRPLSPLDVEAKISQSVIHKEVGCNFEIKPCSPEMLNVEVATPAQNILGERTIEKVTNTLVTKSPIICGTSENDNDMKQKNHMILNENNKIPSCKMISAECLNHDASNLANANNYTLHDLESNAGVCFASLPRLDNDIELNFPEVNQQFINANKESVIMTNDLAAARNTMSNDLKSKTTEQAEESESIKKVIVATDSEKEFSKLSKYRKIKRNDAVSIDKQAEINSQSLRTDSVIIKNPENNKSIDNKFADDNSSNDKKEGQLKLTNKAIVNNPLHQISDKKNKQNDMLDEVAIDFSFSKVHNKLPELDKMPCAYEQVPEKAPEDYESMFGTNTIIAEQPAFNNIIELTREMPDVANKNLINDDDMMSPNNRGHTVLLSIAKESTSNEMLVLNNENLRQQTDNDCKSVGHSKSDVVLAKDIKDSSHDDVMDFAERNASDIDIAVATESNLKLPLNIGIESLSDKNPVGDNYYRKSKLRKELFSPWIQKLTTRIVGKCTTVTATQTHENKIKTCFSEKNENLINTDIVNSLNKKNDELLLTEIKIIGNKSADFKIDSTDLRLPCTHLVSLNLEILNRVKKYDEIDLQTEIVDGGDKSADLNIDTPCVRLANVSDSELDISDKVAEYDDEEFQKNIENKTADGHYDGDYNRLLNNVKCSLDFNVPQNVERNDANGLESAMISDKDKLEGLNNNSVGVRLPDLDKSALGFNSMNSVRNCEVLLTELGDKDVPTSFDIDSNVVRSSAIKEAVTDFHSHQNGGENNYDEQLAVHNHINNLIVDTHGTLSKGLLDKAGSQYGLPSLNVLCDTKSPEVLKKISVFKYDVGSQDVLEDIRSQDVSDEVRLEKESDDLSDDVRVQNVSYGAKCIESQNVISEYASDELRSQDVLHDVAPRDISEDVGSRYNTAGVGLQDILIDAGSRRLSNGVGSRDIADDVGSREISDDVEPRDISDRSQDILDDIGSRDISDDLGSRKILDDVVPRDIPDGSQDILDEVGSHDISDDVGSQDISDVIESREVSHDVVSLHISDDVGYRDLSDVGSQDILDDFGSQDILDDVGLQDISAVGSKDISDNVKSQVKSNIVESHDVSHKVRLQDGSDGVGHDGRSQDVNNIPEFSNELPNISKKNLSGLNIKNSIEINNEEKLQEIINDTNKSVDLTTDVEIKSVSDLNTSTNVEKCDDSELLTKFIDKENKSDDLSKDKTSLSYDNKRITHDETKFVRKSESSKMCNNLLTRLPYISSDSNSDYAKNGKEIYDKQFTKIVNLKNRSAECKIHEVEVLNSPDSDTSSPINKCDDGDLPTDMDDDKAAHSNLGSPNMNTTKADLNSVGHVENSNIKELTEMIQNNNKSAELNIHSDEERLQSASDLNISGCDSNNKNMLTKKCELTKVNADSRKVQPDSEMTNNKKNDGEDLTEIMLGEIKSDGLYINLSKVGTQDVLEKDFTVIKTKNCELLTEKMEDDIETKFLQVPLHKEIHSKTIKDCALNNISRENYLSTLVKSHDCYSKDVTDNATKNHLAKSEVNSIFKTESKALVNQETEVHSIPKTESKALVNQETEVYSIHKTESKALVYQETEVHSIPKTESKALVNQETEVYSIHKTESKALVYQETEVHSIPKTESKALVNQETEVYSIHKTESKALVYQETEVHSIPKTESKALVNQETERYDIRNSEGGFTLQVSYNSASEEDSIEKALKEIHADTRLPNNDCIREERFPKRNLKRSFSDSALDMYNSDIQAHFTHEENALEIKKFRNNNTFLNVCGTPLNEVLNIKNNRRNSISSAFNAENLSFCIVIDNNCIITEENEEEKMCYAELSEECLTDIREGAVSKEDLESAGGIILLPQEENCQFVEPLTESWVDDVACIETVVSDDIAEDIVISAPSSPRVDEESDSDESYIFSNHAEKVKYIYGDKMCHDDAEFVETLYRTPQMNVNKTLINREFHGSDDGVTYEKLTEESDHPGSHLEIISHKPEVAITDDVIKDIVAEEAEIPTNTYDTIMPIAISEQIHTETAHNSNISDGNTQDETVNSCESSIDDVFSYNQKDDSISCTASSSPEVSSTTSEEKNSTILLKITNYKGTITSQLTDVHLNRPQRNISCKFTENNNYSNYQSNSTEPRPLITKAAQKYIPPPKETVGDLKIKLPLPQHSLMKFKQLKVSRNERLRHMLPKKEVQKKPKPRFEDVLKSIDEMQFKKHKEKNKKPKKSVPKVIIKKNENGSHYASTPHKETFNPDLTGRKWQPWVFLEKNIFIDKMALRRKTKAIYNHRNNTFVFADRFKKYKSAPSANFVISQPNLDNPPVGQFKYTIRLKHSY